jgi:hypothetical protein
MGSARFLLTRAKQEIAKRFNAEGAEKDGTKEARIIEAEVRGREPLALFCSIEAARNFGRPVLARQGHEGDDC